VFRRIVVEAVSVDQALSRLQSEAPEGYEVLHTEILSDAKADTITCSAPTTESAFGKARHKVPKGASLTEEIELRQPGSESITIEAPDEATGRAQVEGQVEDGTKIQFLKLENEGSSGFLGIGKKPRLYRAQLFHPAVVRVSYQATAKVSATLMSREAAEQARAAAQELMDLHDQGGEAVTEQIRMVGFRLESTGGVELMLAAHTLFSKERPRARRVVEQAWDGIGAWIG
jgi:hypothetical protein